MRSREDIRALIPHQGTMCLLDSVAAWTSQHVHCRTCSHQRDDNPLRRGGRLRAVHLCEYGAQAMAVHGGLLAAADGGVMRPGLLVSLRGMQIDIAWLHDLEGELDVRAEVLLTSVDSWQYRVAIAHGNRTIAAGRAAVMLREP